ncbi:MAG TPA: ribonuclease E inhibitor RraB [Steroidobacteraceae bacterium]
MTLAFFIAVLVAGVVVVVRIYTKLRNFKRLKTETWDAKLVEDLRAKGYAPFNDYPVDFFLALPTEASCATVRTELEGEGFTVDVKPVDNDPELHFSLHATKMMRLIVPMMQEMTAHLTAVAEKNGGRYDGWTA